MRSRLATISLILSAGLIAGSPAHAENGVSADKLVLGQAAALDGPAAALGKGMRDGLQAAFAEANKAGGVKGRKIELLSIDDGYEPNKSIAAAKKLIEEDKVFALIGSVGTPTSAAVEPIAGVKRALEKRKMELVAEGTYERNTTAVKAALLAIKKGEPEAVIMIGAYKPSAEFIKLARQIKLDATFVNISFVGSDALAKELGSAGAGVVVTQVVPFPRDPSVPLVGRYQAALKALNPELQPGFVSLEGYIAGRVLIEGLGKVEGDLTRKALLDAVAKSGGFDLGGMKLVYGPDNNRGSSHVFLTVIQADGSLQAVDKLAKTGG